MFGQRASSQIVCRRCAVDELADVEVARVGARRAHLHPLGPARPLGDGSDAPSVSLDARSAAVLARLLEHVAQMPGRPIFSWIGCGPEAGAVASRREARSSVTRLEHVRRARRGCSVEAGHVVRLTLRRLASELSRAIVVNAASSRPQAVIQLGERRRVEVDVERVAVRRHPARDVDADRADLPRRSVEPDAGQPVDPRALDAVARRACG